jgi:hypothetical protein
MPARNRRVLSSRTVEEVLMDGCTCRRAMVRLSTEAPIGSPPYRAAVEVLDALDKLAEALTGDRTLWHLKPRGMGS